MKRTYLDSSVLIQAVQGVDGDKIAALLEDPEREFVAATFLKLELLPQPTFHKRKAELEFLAAYFERVAAWREADESLVAAAVKAAGPPRSRANRCTRPVVSKSPFFQLFSG